MLKIGKSELQAGIFLVVGLVLMVITIFTLGQERQIFSRQEPYHVYFSDVKGLSSGAPIRLGGITIGRVDSITFSDDLKDNRIRVTLLLNEQYLARIREDSKVSIQTQGLLGDKMVSVSSGVSLVQVPPNSTLLAEEGGDLSQIMENAGKLASDVSEISESVKATLTQFQSETLANLNESMENIAAITSEIKDGDGPLNRVIFPKKDESGPLQELEEAAKSVKAILKEVEEGEGLLHALVYEPRGRRTVRSLESASKGISKATEELTLIAREIRTGNGLLNSVIYQESPEGLDQIMAKLAASAENLEKATRAISEGQGTLGALLIDSSVYDNLVEVTDEAKRSVLLRSAIRSSLATKERGAD